METKLAKIFRFLQANRQYCLNSQQKHREAELLPFKSESDRVFSLLYHTFYSQPQPKLDYAQVFFEDIGNKSNVLNSFKTFCQYLDPEKFNQTTPYISLYEGLRKKDGWGRKTSALFVKNVYNIHTLPQMEHLRFWTDDIPKLVEPDRLHLPVDAVIMDIFSRFDSALKSFDNINKALSTQANMDIWDDLWFWGFISQKGSESPRELVFNKGKYWLLLYTPKDPKSVKEIGEKCNEFISIIRS